MGISITQAGLYKIPTTNTAENYSGITHISGNQYAIVSDTRDGYFLSTIELNSDGTVASFQQGNFYGDASPATRRDCEGIAYHEATGTLFISGEADQQILQYDAQGRPTGTGLAIPGMFGKDSGTGNYGFEALTYSRWTNTFWTTTESTLPSRDGAPGNKDNPVGNLLRLQSFDGTTFASGAQYAYKTDAPKVSFACSNYAFGVPDMLALPGGRLLVMEREFAVGEGSLGKLKSFTHVKIYLVDPRGAVDVAAIESLRADDEVFLEKRMLAEFSGNISSLANYEGITLGPKLGDKTYSLLLINDSQNRNSGILHEYIQALTITGIVLPEAASRDLPGTLALIAGALLGSLLLIGAVTLRHRRRKTANKI